MENEGIRDSEQEEVLVEELDCNEEFQWILNEDLLRDEGVMYGLTDGDAKEKLQTIELFYVQKAKNLLLQAEQVSAEIQEVEQALEATQAQIEQEENTLQSFEEATDNRKTGFLRQTINLISYTAAVLLIFWLMYSWLEPHLEYPILIAVGVYIFGSLNLFTPGSFLFAMEAAHLEENPRERWKLFLEELVVPLVAVFFVIAWGYNGQGIQEAIALGALLYALFLFSGKGLLTTIEKWTTANQDLRNKWALRRLIKQRIAEQKVLIAELNQTQENLRDRLAELQEKKNELEKEAGDYKETAETRKAYFMSEFALARSARNQLSGEQLMQLSTFKKS